jgi:hypothetical protein
MAQIILSGHEVVGILQANACIPPQIMEITADDEEIKLKVRTDWPILKSMRVGMRFAGYDNGCLVMQLATNLLTDKFNWLVDRMIEPLRLEEHGGRWEYPRLYIDVNRLVQRQLRGVTVENIVFQDGLFHVTTAHANCTACTGDSEGQEDISASRAAPV